MRAFKRLLLRQYDIKIIVLSHLAALAYQIVNALGLTPLNDVRLGDLTFQVVQRYAPIAFTVASFVNSILFYKTLRRALTFMEAIERVSKAYEKVTTSIRVLFKRRRRKSWLTAIALAVCSAVLGVVSYLILHGFYLALAFLALTPVSAYSAYHMINSRI